MSSRGSNGAGDLASSESAPAGLARDEGVIMQDAGASHPMAGSKYRVTVDCGTKYGSASVRIIPPNPSPATHFDIHDATFQDGKPITPQIIGFTTVETGEREVIWGSDVEDAIKSKKLKVEDTIEMWKLVLYKEHANSATVQQVLDQLKKHNLTIVELIALHLEHLLPAIREGLDKSTIGLLVSGMNALPMELYLSVPQMWEPPACQQMVAAASMVAHKTGIEVVKLVREPECATALHLHDVSRQLAAGFRINDEIIVADIGGGTGDFLRVVYETDPSNGAKVVLKSTGKSEGSLCGSEFVNEEFRNFLKRKARSEVGSFKAKCAELGLTEMACLKEASDGFEKIKLAFTIVDAAPVYVVVRNNDVNLPPWLIAVTSKDMIRFYESPLYKIKRCIRKQLTPNTKVVLVTGGFSNSKYLMAKLKAEFAGPKLIVRHAYENPRSERAVSIGAQLRWEEVESKNFDMQQASFVIGTEEVFDEHLHPDAVANKKKYVVACPFSSVDVVKNRALPVISQVVDEDYVTGSQFTAFVWQQSIVDKDCKVLLIQVYWTKKPIEKHDPVRKGPQVDSELEDGVEEWGPPISIELPNLKDLGFKTETVYTNQFVGAVYEFYWRLTFHGEGPNVEFTWELARPGTQPFDQDGNAIRRQVKTAGPVVHKLCSKDFNPFPASNF